MADLQILTKVENKGAVTNDVNVLLEIKNGISAIVCGWVVWNVPPTYWAGVIITVLDIDQIIGGGNFNASAKVFDTITPGIKIDDLIVEGNKIGETYKGFTTIGNQLDYAEASFTIGEEEAELKIINIGILGA